MRIVCAILASGFFVLLGSSSHAADLSVEHGRSSAHRSGGYEVRMRVVEQVPYCGDCDNLLGHAHSPYVRLREVGYPFWEEGCALGGCAAYYRTIQRCWFWGLEGICD